MADNSKTASILVLIGAILTFVLVGILIIFLTIIFLLARNQAPMELFLILGVFIVIAISGLAIGGLKIWASNLIKNPEEKKKGGMIALISGIIFGPDILSIIGGIMALSENGTKR